MSTKQLRILLILVCSCIGCSVEATRSRLSDPGDNTIVLRPIEAVLHQPQSQTAYIKKFRIPSGDSLIEHAQFIDKQRGWISTSQSLFRTSDGGSSWEQLRVDVPEYSRISSFFFIDDSLGWLVIAKQIHAERYGLGNSSKILNTKDGGSKWTEQANFASEIKINEIAFYNRNNGFAAGAKIIDQPLKDGPPYEEAFIVTTKDAGKVWVDVSQAFNNAIKNEGGNISDSGSSIHWLSADKIHLLTRNGRIVTTLNQGGTWTITARLEDERPSGEVSSTGYHKLVFDPEQQIRVIAGAMGDEGYWGDLIVNGKDGGWSSYELGQVPLFDALYLSNNDVLASGIAMGTPNIAGEKHSAGVILHSSDGGKSWAPIYTSRTTEAFLSLTQFGAREFYAVSDRGTLLAFAL